MTVKSLLSIKDLSADEILAILTLAKAIKASPKHYNNSASHKILALLFFEPSTRTYFSFSSAMHRLGGTVIGSPQMDSTSISKGESLEDTARVMAGYADMLVIRHAESAAIQCMQEAVDIPILSAGAGTGEHPSQAITDLFTIYEHFSRLDVCIGLYGDLKFGRTNHSLLLAAARFGARFICIAPDELQMPGEYLKQIQPLNPFVTFTDDIMSCIADIDVLYVSRVQKERLSAQLNYADLKQRFTVDNALTQKLKPSSIIMHPLPRVGEIDPIIDKDPRAYYFKQASNGVFTRMGLILTYLFGIK